MPEIKPQDYTKRELTQAANICTDAADLLEPASDELGRLVDDLKADRPENALFYSRTSRHLLGASFHLRGGAIGLHEIAETTGHTYASVKSWYHRLVLAAWTVVLVFALLKLLVLPKHAGQIVVENMPFGIGVALGFSAALWILEHYVTGTRCSGGRRR